MPNQSSFLRISGAQPFSAFMNKGGGTSKRYKIRTKNVSRKKNERKNKTIQRKRSNQKKRSVQKKKRSIQKKKSIHKSKSSRRKSNRSSNTLTLPTLSSEKELRCNCDKKRKIKGNEPSPKGFGYCAHCTPLNVMMRGKDGKLWENKKYTKGKRWIRVKSPQSGGFLRSGTF